MSGKVRRGRPAGRFVSYAVAVAVSHIVACYAWWPLLWALSPISKPAFGWHFVPASTRMPWYISSPLSVPWFFGGISLASLMIEAPPRSLLIIGWLCYLVPFLVVFVLLMRRIEKTHRLVAQ